MGWISKHKRTLILSFVLLAIILISIYATTTGLARTAYVAGVTEMRLAYRGNSMAQIRFSPKDEMGQIYIPAGEFTMGSNSGANAKSTQEHKVYLDSYWINQIEVTNAMYALCYKAGKCRHTAHYDRYFDDPAYADYPVHYINWYDAKTFCTWEGGRLPTEAEWEKAARGIQDLRYPWGDIPPDNSLLNFNGFFQGPKSAYDYLTGISPYGLLNMAGNLQEWVADWYSADYYSNSPYKDPPGPTTGDLKVLRGGGYWDNATEVQTFYRFKHDPASAGEHRGIRCVQDAAQKTTH